MSKTLEEIRVAIDAIDDQVHNLLMQRAQLVSSVSAAKKKDGLQVVHPAREARMMRRLLNQHKGPLPRETIVRIWRELVGSVSLLQAGLSVVVSSEVDEHSYWDMAQNYFGSAIPIKKVSGNLNAIADVKNGKASFAVLPWPELEENSAWWGQLIDQHADDEMSIICALPYGRKKEDDKDIYDRAVILSKMNFMSSDNDVSFVVLKLDVDVTRAFLVKKAEEAGLKVLSAFTGYSEYEATVKLHLLEVDGYVGSTSEEVSELQRIIGDQCLYCASVGGYPVISDIYNA